jgi:integrase
VTKRRSSGDGSVYRIRSGRDAGRWCAQVDLGWTDKGTRNRPRRFPKPNTETAAKILLKELLKRRDAGVREIRTAHDWLGYWLEHVIRPSSAPATYATYRQAVRWAKSGISERTSLLDLKPQHIRQMQATMRAAGASPARVWYVTATLNTCLNAALSEQLLIRNPVKPVLEKTIRPEGVKRAALVWDDAMTAIDRTTDPRTRARLVVGFMAGLRPSEAIGLRWDNIDLLDDGGVWRGVLHVDGQMGRHGTAAGQRVEPKSRNGFRPVPLEPSAAAILAAWRAVAPESVWVFPGANPERPVRYETDRAWFVRALEAAGVPAITPHGARATFSTRLLDQGVSVAVAARLLGDLPETLIRHYARSTEGIEREAMKALEG